jgi:hypothetical protein
MQRDGRSLNDLNVDVFAFIEERNPQLTGAIVCLPRRLRNTMLSNPSYVAGVYAGKLLGFWDDRPAFAVVVCPNGLT